VDHRVKAIRGLIRVDEEWLTHGLSFFGMWLGLQMSLLRFPR